MILPSAPESTIELIFAHRQAAVLNIDQYGFIVSFTVNLYDILFQFFFLLGHSSICPSKTGHH